jgi:hypothetical protein
MKNNFYLFVKNDIKNFFLRLNIKKNILMKFLIFLVLF